MRRRRFLASVGALAASAGCASTTDSTTTTSERDAPEAPRETTTTRAPPTVEQSAFAGVEVPPLGDATAWYHEAGAETPAFVKPGTEQTGFPVAATFAFRNRTGEPVGCGGWTLYKLVDGDWYRIRGSGAGVCEQLDAGDVRRWAFYAKNGRPFRVIQDEDGLHFPFLGGGRYAFEAGYALPEGPRAAALFDVDGPALAVEPEFGASVEREDGTVTVTTERWESGDERAELVGEPVSSGGRRVIAEQCYQSRFGALRNVVAFAGENVAEVVVRTDRRGAERAVPTGDPRVSFRGASFSLSVRT